MTADETTRLQAAITEMRTQVKYGLPPRSSVIEEWANAAESALEAARQEIARLKLFEEAIIDAGLVNWTYREEHKTNPMNAIADLIACIAEESLDPNISEAASILVKRAESAEAQRDAIRGNFETQSRIDGERIHALEAQLDALTREHAELKVRASTLEDAAFHFQSCRTCAEDGEDSCTDGRKFAAYLRGEGL